MATDLHIFNCSYGFVIYLAQQNNLVETTTVLYPSRGGAWTCRVGNISSGMTDFHLLTFRVVRVLPCSRLCLETTTFVTTGPDAYGRVYVRAAVCHAFTSVASKRPMGRILCRFFHIHQPPASTYVSVHTNCCYRFHDRNCKQGD